MSNANIGEFAIELLQMCAGGQVREAYDKHVDARFRHHNPYFRSDRASLMEAMADSATRDPSKSFRVMKVMPAGDTVALLSRLEREQGRLVYAVVHILRFEGDRIVEMWDLAQPVPDDSPNELGMF
jgi:predicted SnoaL-like aldol condensation-catalyzing enzyme